LAAVESRKKIFAQNCIKRSDNLLCDQSCSRSIPDGA